MQEARPFPRAWVVAIAIVWGIIGTVVGLAITLWRQGDPLGDPEFPAIFMNAIWAFCGAALGGGIGWLLGAVVGWRAVRSESPPQPDAGSWPIRILALGFVVTGAVVVRAIPSGPPDLLSYQAAPLRALVILDTTLAVVTLLVVSLRSPAQPRIVTAGATVAVVLMVGAASIFTSLPPPGQAWLERWLSTRQAPLGAAPNLITPAPVRCAASSPAIAPADDRSFDGGVPGPPLVYYWINPFAPRWLPEGFGLALDRSSPFPTPHGVWTDVACREVVLLVTSRKLRSITWPPTDGDVAGWTLAPPTWCSDPSSGCREYLAKGTFRRGGAPALLVLRTVGLDPDEADRIARSIPTERVPYR